MPKPDVPNCKGTDVLNAVKWLRLNRERALAMLPPRLHHYLEDRILVSSWYPEEDQFGLLKVIAALMPAGGPDPWVLMGRATANTNLTSLYRNQLRVGDPERTLTFASAFWRNGHDTGELSITSDGPTRLIGRLRGYRRPSRELCKIVSGYFLELVKLSAQKEGSVVHSACALDGASDCLWTVSWG